MRTTCIALFGAVLLTFGVSSCSKSYTCHCVYKTDGQVTHEDNSKISEGSKDKSASKCAEMDNTTTQTVSGYTSTSTTECTLN